MDQKKLIEQVKAAGTELYESAPELVGNMGFISKFEINIKFEPGLSPVITLIRGHLIINIDYK